MARLAMMIFLALVVAAPTRAFDSVNDPRRWAITGVTIIDIDSGAAIPNQTIVIQGGVILAVGDSSAIVSGSDVVIADQAGRFAIPGLWDMHIHLRGGAALIDANERWLRQYLGFGVTSVREMGGDLPHSVMHWKAEVAEGFVTGPRIYSALQKLDGPGVRQSGSIPVDSAESLDAALDYLKLSGADFIKLYDFSFPASLYPVAVHKAAARDLKTAAHVALTVPFEALIDAGLGSVEHSFYLLKAANPEDRRLSAGLVDVRAEDYVEYFTALTGMAAGADEAHARRIFRAMASQGTAITGTLQIDHEIDAFLRGEDIDTSRLTQTPELIRETLASAREYLDFVGEDLLPSQRIIVRRAFPLVRLAAEEGVMILAGSDTGADNPFVYPGDSVHAELERMVEIGMSPLQALRAATLDPARWMGLDGKFGALSPGMAADIVILDANPLANISNTRSITAVVQQGVYFDAGELAELRALVGR